MGRKKKEPLTKRQRHIERYIKKQDAGEETKLKTINKPILIKRKITENVIKKFQNCLDCQKDSVIEIQLTLRGKLVKVGVCGKHWTEFSETTYNWSSILH